MTNTRESFRHVDPTVLAFCEGAQICPTDCDDDCDTPCHEWHAIPSRRDHQPDECPSAARAINGSQP
ncbi:hypothetical protein ACFXKY_07825 [Streptomyces canus]|uniref:hypothetical protein n=1 Tax=Streptomyces canus TaxID=58343 RepID=UPI0036C5155E